MSTLRNLAWRCVPKFQRRLLLDFLPEYRQREFERTLVGKMTYPDVFDRTQSIFIHVPKNAGKSVTRALYGVKTVGHTTASWYQQADPEKFQRYFKCAFVRNPWDRVASTFTYLRQGGAESSPQDREWSAFMQRFGSFDEFVTGWLTPDNARLRTVLTPQYLFLVNRFGVVEMDFIGRVENVTGDFTVIADKLGVAAELPHLNRSAREDYRALYTDRSREIVGNIYQRDIELFGYDFDGPLA
ncbi:sulfotransferase family 2 domain-containing protein [Biformimicrobium ophioploci]|uniref:Sulfotransferase family protein n=1 Tax=Biformimicrobium ophioploci TaxID=3036711 RepID=A0ABQ6M0L1_9GAMM|nr:sulfotransferase family 2 domain-containing protein [Microbulbifer sp. NKW57]GMG87881.1 hypothetical protein MNKW57_22020 [Microbulbifer sp. NKW57]